MLRLVGHPVAVNPDTELARVARAQGWEIMRFERLGRTLRIAAGAAALAGALAAAEGSPVPELTHEQREIRDLARRFADEQIAPHAAQWDREHHFPARAVRRAGRDGLMGVCVAGRARRRRSGTS